MTTEEAATEAVSAVLVVHGGAGAIQDSSWLSPRNDACREALREALRIGYAVLLRENGTALDAVEAAVRFLEDCPLFNAGRGSVFTHARTIEMDASIMDGAAGRAGAVTGVTTVRHPVTLARAVMELSPFVFLSGAGAEEFAVVAGVERADPEYFRTEERWAQLMALMQQESERTEIETALSEDEAHGTVGAVAVDRNGNVAAATSTGGMTNKRYGRIGDSPVIGAGTWAENATCAISCTGHGEYFLRRAVAHDVAARVAYLGESVAAAAHAVIHGPLRAIGGAGGLIAIDRNGNAALPFNSSGMYRGCVTQDGQTAVAIFQEPLTASEC